MEPVFRPETRQNKDLDRLHGSTKCESDLDDDGRRPPRPFTASRRAFLCAALATGLPAGLAAPAVAKNLDPIDAFVEVADGIHVRPGLQQEITAENDGAIANIGFIVGEESVAVFDTGTTRRQGEALRRAVARVTEKPISHLVASHVHQDHCFGHIAFAGARLANIGHKNLPRALAARAPYYLKELARISPRLADAGCVPPTTLVADETPIDLGNRIVALRAWPTAHTDNDLTAFDEKTGALFTGDLLFNGRLPTLDGSLAGWLKVLPDLLGPKVKTAIPGHGPIGDGRAALEAETGYLTRLRDRVRQAIDDQLDIDTTVARLKDDNREGWKLFATNHERNVIAAYTELEWE
ncbi:MAG: quinoprotein relay system zinc metallohydrolase 2 [Pararhizobium sp.]